MIIQKFSNQVKFFLLNLYYDFLNKNQPEFCTKETRVPAILGDS